MKVKGHLFSSQETVSLQHCLALPAPPLSTRPREGVTPGRKMGRKLLGNSACSQEGWGIRPWPCSI